MPFRLLLGLLLVLATAHQPPAPTPDAIGELVLRLEAAAKAGDRAAVLALAKDAEAAGEFPDVLGAFVPSRAVLKERDRVQIEGGGQRLLLELFSERGAEGRLSTWSVHVVPEERTWKIADVTRLANVAGLHRLALNPAKQFE